RNRPVMKSRRLVKPTFSGFRAVAGLGLVLEGVLGNSKSVPCGARQATLAWIADFSAMANERNRRDLAVRRGISEGRQSTQLGRTSGRLTSPPRRHDRSLPPKASNGHSTHCAQCRLSHSPALFPGVRSTLTSNQAFAAATASISISHSGATSALTMIVAEPG